MGSDSRASRLGIERSGAAALHPRRRGGGGVRTGAEPAALLLLLEATPAPRAHVTHPARPDETTVC
eukprot:scaffold79527_cov54-Phaeocystis_antarctica.AAC.1